MKNSKAKYVKPEAKVFYVFAECEVAKVSSTEGGGPIIDPDKPDGNGNDMNAKQNNSWFNWDDESEE